MAQTATLYIGNGFKTFALYSQDRDVYKTTPRRGLHLAHITYSFGNIHRAIDVWQGSDDGLHILNMINMPPEALDHVDIAQGVHYTLNRVMGSALEEMVVRTARRDILEFCKKPAADGSTSIVLVDRIVPVTAIRFVNPNYLLTSGKSDYVEPCIIGANLDFSTAKSQCMAEFIPGDSFGIQSSFDGQTFTGYFSSPRSKCIICYAGRHHLSPYAKSFMKIDPEALRDALVHGIVYGSENNPKVHGKHVKVLRLGKRTETGAKITRKQLMTTFEVAARTGTRIIMPTRALEHDAEVAEGAIDSRASILLSVGRFDHAEEGMTLHNYSLESRLEQAVKFKDSGVNVGLYLLIDAPSAPQQGDLEILAFAEKYHIPVQFLPLTLPSREAALVVLGKSWSSLKQDYSTEQAFNVEEWGGYARANNGFLRPIRIHPFWNNLVGKNKGSVAPSISNPNTTEYGMCHHIEPHHATPGQAALAWCRGCNLTTGCITKSKKAVIDYTLKKATQRRKKRLPQLFPDSEKH